jgi:hypothetical protein
MRFLRRLTWLYAPAASRGLDSVLFQILKFFRQPLLLIIILVSMLFSCIPIEHYGHISVFVDPGYKNIMDREIRSIHDIYTGNLKRVAKIPGVKLISLTVADPDNIDFSPLAEYEELHSLSIKAYGDGKFTNFPDLSALKNLESLSVDSSSIVTSVVVRKKTHGLKRAGFIEKVSFEPDYVIVNWERLNEMTQLKSLSIYYDRDFSLTELYKLNNLERLKITTNVYEDVTIDLKGIECFPLLKELYLENGKIKNMYLLAGVKTLEVLTLEYNFEDDKIDFLKGLPNLRKLTIYKSGHRTRVMERQYYTDLDISPLSDLVKLELLDLRGFIVQDSLIADTLPSLKRFISWGNYMEADIDSSFK